MRTIRDFHHYKEREIAGDDRICRLERRVVDLLLTSSLKEEERDSSVAFELKHSSATTQFSRLLARKRNLHEEICAAGAVLHDIYVIVRGKYKDHARLGEPIARELLKEAGFHDRSENERIIQLIVNHSDKHLFSDDPYVEFGKDADVLDCFLYPKAVEFYLRHKPLGHMFHYLGRAKNIWRDLGIATLPNFLTLLDTYRPNWLDKTERCDPLMLVQLLNSAKIRSFPNFLLRVHDGLATVTFNSEEMRQDNPLEGVSILRGLLRPPSASTEVLHDYFQGHGISLADCYGIMVWAPIEILEAIANAPAGLARIRELAASNDLVFERGLTV